VGGGMEPVVESGKVKEGGIGIWVFPKIRVPGYPKKWMVYNGKPYKNG